MQSARKAMALVSSDSHQDIDRFLSLHSWQEQAAHACEVYKILPSVRDFLLQSSKRQSQFTRLDSRAIVSLVRLSEVQSFECIDTFCKRAKYATYNTSDFFQGIVRGILQTEQAKKDHIREGESC